MTARGFGWVPTSSDGLFGQYPSHELDTFEVCSDPSPARKEPGDRQSHMSFPAFENSTNEQGLSFVVIPQVTHLQSPAFSSADSFASIS